MQSPSPDPITMQGRGTNGKIYELINSNFLPLQCCSLCKLFATVCSGTSITDLCSLTDHMLPSLSVRRRQCPTMLSSGCYGSPSPLPGAAHGLLLPHPAQPMIGQGRGGDNVLHSEQQQLLSGKMNVSSPCTEQDAAVNVCSVWGEKDGPTNPRI